MNFGLTQKRILKKKVVTREKAAFFSTFFSIFLDSLLVSSFFEDFGARVGAAQVWEHQIYPADKDKLSI